MPHDLAAIRLQSLHPTVENLFPVVCPTTVESLLHAFELMSAAFDPRLQSGERQFSPSEVWCIECQ
jgi:hypothetical protein